MKLPFTEEFRITPSPDVFVELGPLMVSEYEETWPIDWGWFLADSEVQLVLVLGSNLPKTN